MDGGPWTYELGTRIHTRTNSAVGRDYARRAVTPVTRGVGDTLEGESVVPGFTYLVTDLFA